MIVHYADEEGNVNTKSIQSNQPYVELMEYTSSRGYCIDVSSESHSTYKTRKLDIHHFIDKDGHKYAIASSTKAEALLLFKVIGKGMLGVEVSMVFPMHEGANKIPEMMVERVHKRLAHELVNTLLKKKLISISDKKINEYPYTHSIKYTATI